MCCVGFACLAQGCTPEQIFQVDTAEQVFGRDLKGKNSRGYPRWEAYYRDGQLPNTTIPKWARFSNVEYDPHNLEPLRQLYYTNDDEEMSEDTREARIVELGAKIGLEFVFVN